MKYQDKIIELLKLAAINERYVSTPLFEEGFFLTVDFDGTDEFTGMLDEVIEWEKGYTSYIEWEKKHGKDQDDRNKR